MPSERHRGFGIRCCGPAAVAAAALALLTSGAEALSQPHPPGPCRCTTYCTCLDNGCCPRKVCSGNCNPVFGGAAQSRSGTAQSRPPARLQLPKPVAPGRGRR
jgi:hypothetical protein